MCIKCGLRRHNRHCPGAVRAVTIDDFSADYLMVKAMDTRKTPAEIISEMVREWITALV
jgi:hypothetical protein